MIYKFPVVCQYLENSAMEQVPYEESWVSKHCRISQYFLQIVKYTDDKWCGPFVQTDSEYFQIDSFLLQFSLDKILEAQLFHRLAISKQLIVMLIYGNALL